MENYTRIVNALEDYIKKKSKKREIAIYPFGAMGVKTKEILNWRYGIEEAIIVDNYLCSINPHIKNIAELDRSKEYDWIIACDNMTFRQEILDSIKTFVPEDHIIDIFSRRTSVSLYSRQEFRLLYKLETDEMKNISRSCTEILEIIQKKKRENRKIAVAEIGVGCGATAVEVCRHLTHEDTYFCFDFEDVIEDLLYDLNKIPEIKCKRIGKGNTHRVYDSYSWNLCELLFQMRNENMNGIFDVVYLDGAHTFIHDGATCCLLKELLKQDGYIVFDDMFWTCKSSKGVFPYVKDLYTNQQLEDAQVQRVVNAFMINAKRFQQIFMSTSINSERAVYVKMEN
ncbi:MAG: class I SAM-dependent methyltransferase [Lachnospiraceae bacterium]|jgi:predicted O-methyltransferase YrrM|nr:class I SAM-dependent methyltransferase [Lachnospiraceae bacterium]